MKMLLIVYDSSMDTEIRDLLESLGVTAYSQIPKVFGQGESGVFDGSWICPGHNACILTALPDEKATHVACGLEAYRKGKEFVRCAPVRAFAWPCEQLM